MAALNQAHLGVPVPFSHIVKVKQDTDFISSTYYKALMSFLPLQNFETTLLCPVAVEPISTEEEI